MSDIPSSQMPYRVNEILRRVGPAVAVVHSILVATDDADGSRTTGREMANPAGINRTVRRCIEWFPDAVLVQSEAQLGGDIWRSAHRSVEG